MVPRELRYTHVIPRQVQELLMDEIETEEQDVTGAIEEKTKISSQLVEEIYLLTSKVRRHSHRRHGNQLGQ